MSQYDITFTTAEKQAGEGLTPTSGTQSARSTATNGAPPGPPADVSRAQSELEALRREIERWHVLVGGDRGLLEALLHHSPHGIFVSDPNGKFILQNRAAERIWAGSATLESVETWGLYRAFHPDGRPFEPTDWSMSRCLSRREIIEAEEVHFQRFDGTHGILLGSCAPIFNPAGDIDGAVAVFADITVLKQVEERLQIITDSLPVLISYFDASLCCRFANLGHERWLGRSRSAIAGKHVREIFGEDAYARLLPGMEQALRGETVQIETRFPHSDGEPRIVDATCIPHFGPDHSVQGFVALISDITERRRLEQARAQWAARTERLLRITAALADAVTPEQVTQAVVDHTAAVLGATSCGLWLIDDGGQTATLSRAVGYSDAGRARFARLALRGVELPVVDALRTGDAVWTEAPDRLAQLFPSAAEDRDPPSGAAVAGLPMTVEGRTIGALMLTFDRATAPAEEDRALVRVVAQHCAQALERMRVLQEREDLIQKLSQTVRLNELFVGVVGHDLRNPLSAVLNTAQLALRRDEGTRLSKALTRIISASERMTRMIEQLLDFTRTRVGGGIPLDPRETDLGALARHVLDEVEDAHPERSILVELSGDLEGYWDPDRLAQVISNLAGNAVSHGAAQSPVKVSADGASPDLVVFRIWNDGIVRQEMLHVLFEPFRGTGIRRDTAKGLGLGLYITREIVAAHGGTIEVTSSEAAGTTFTIVLPRRVPPSTKR